MDEAAIKIGDETAAIPLTKRGKDNPFRTGSTGYHGQGKAEFNGRNYQVNVLVVEIGSKKV